MKIVIDVSYGGLILSCQAKRKYLDLANVRYYLYQYPSSNEVDEGAEDCYKRVDCFNHDADFVRVIFCRHDLGASVEEIPYDEDFFNKDPKRTDPLLIRVVDELGAEASAKGSELRVVEIPDGSKWQINECGGVEIVE